MTQYNSVNKKLSKLQPSKLKLIIKSATKATLNLSSNMITDSSDKTNFSNRLLLTDKFQSFLRLLRIID